MGPLCGLSIVAHHTWARPIRQDKTRPSGTTVPAHPGWPGLSPESCKIAACVCVLRTMPSILWRCSLDGRKGLNIEWCGADMVICLKQGTDLHLAQMPLPLTVSCFRKIQIVFYFLVPAHLASPRLKANKRLLLLWTILNNKIAAKQSSNIFKP